MRNYEYAKWKIEVVYMLNSGRMYKQRRKYDISALGTYAASIQKFLNKVYTSQ